jgi:hypothetical protein
LSIRRAVAGGVVVTIVAAVLWSSVRSRQASARSQPVAQLPLPRRVTVEVRNTTRASGIARAATAAVRAAGLDVVQSGGADSAQRGRARNEVLVRRGDTTGVGRVVAALGQATVIDAPDSSREVDLTVLIGTDFIRAKPPAKP